MNNCGYILDVAGFHSFISRSELDERTTKNRKLRRKQLNTEKFCISDFQLSKKKESSNYPVFEGHLLP